MTMAQKIVNLCDPHLSEHDEEIPGEPYRVGLCPPGGRWEWVTIDLCPADASALSELAQWLEKYGRLGEPPKAGALAARKGDRWPSGTAKPSRDERRAANGHPCSVCGFVSVSRGALGVHVRSRHGIGLPALEGKPTPYRCEICGREFAKTNGLGVHMRRSHPEHE